MGAESKFEEECPPDKTSLASSTTTLKVFPVNEDPIGTREDKPSASKGTTNKPEADQESNLGQSHQIIPDSVNIAANHSPIAVPPSIPLAEEPAHPKNGVEDVQTGKISDLEVHVQNEDKQINMSTASLPGQNLPSDMPEPASYDPFVSNSVNPAVLQNAPYAQAHPFPFVPMIPGQNGYYGRPPVNLPPSCLVPPNPFSPPPFSNSFPYPPNHHHARNLQYVPNATKPVSPLPIIIDPLQVSSEWKEYIDIKTGNPYYVHRRSLIKQWKRPEGFLTKKELLRPVSAKVIGKSEWKVVATLGGRDYFYNTLTKTTSWELPPDFNTPIIQPDEEEEEKYKEQSVEREKGAYVRKKNSSANALQDELQVEGGQCKRLKVAENGEVDSEDGDTVQAKETVIEFPEDIVPEHEDEFDRRVRQFKRLLREKKVGPDSVWHDFSSELAHDERYHAVVSRVERTSIFESFVRMRRAEVETEKKAALELASTQFLELIDEQASKLSHTTTLNEFKDLFRHDSRYAELQGVDPDQIGVIYDRIIGELKDAYRKKRRKFKLEFLDMLEEKIHEKILKVNRLCWGEAKSLLEEDPRYHRDKLSSEDRHQLFRHFSEDVIAVYEEQLREQKKKRDVLRNLEFEAQRNRAREAHYRGREKRKFALQEEVCNIGSLYSERINRDVRWEDVRDMLEADPRFDTRFLTRSDKKNMFEDHLESLRKKKRDAFTRLVEETGNGFIFKDWEEISQEISKDPRFKQVEDGKKLFEDLKKYKLEKIQTDLVETFKLIPLITKDTDLTEKPKFARIIQSLHKDKAWCYMSDGDKKWCHFREELLKDYIELLQMSHSESESEK